MYPEHKSYLPEIEETVVRNCIDELHMKVRKEEIVQLIKNRYDLINK